MFKSGDQIGKWILDKPIGDGGFGEVWRGHTATPDDGLICALKIARPNDFDAPRARFVREAEALDELQHDAIVGMLGWGDAEVDGEQIVYLAMELVSGQTLLERLRGGSMPAAQVETIFGQMAAGLEHAHGVGFAHRDIKPENLMLTADGNAKILDFGVALEDDRSRLTHEGGMVGTTAYMPPEVFVDPDPNAKLGDIYSLGVLLYEVLTHSPAFRMPSLRGRERKIAMMQAKRNPLDPGEGYSDGVRDFVGRATHPDPKQRIETMTEFRRGLEALHGTFERTGPPPTKGLEELSESTLATGTTSSAARPRKIWPYLVVAAVLGALGVGMFTSLVLLFFLL